MIIKKKSISSPGKRRRSKMDNAKREDAHVHPEKLRSALARYATGVAIVTTRTKVGKLEGLTVNSFASLSLDPPLILWSLRRLALSLPSFLESRAFIVNVLSGDQSRYSRHFAEPSPDKFQDVSFSLGFGDCPILPDPLAVFECSTETTTDGGDHVIFIGRVRRVSHRDGYPLIFSGGKYCTHTMLPSQTTPRKQGSR
jgi:flavin reductase (DIM6/NTAB) family NADH-FMN oxidoreductase RutF